MTPITILNALAGASSDDPLGAMRGVVLALISFFAGLLIFKRKRMGLVLAKGFFGLNIVFGVISVFSQSGTIGAAVTMVIITAITGVVPFAYLETSKRIAATFPKAAKPISPAATATEKQPTV